ncbi:MAG: hypothetical protein KGZ85_05385, partial [Ignavibacterium sp.]|nr:hypothetical protein [Ignavibacterium sp.]
MAFQPKQIKEKIIVSSKKEKILISEKTSEQETIELEIALQKGLVSVRDLIAPASMKITPNHLILGNTYVRTLFVISYPNEISVG